MNTNGAHILVIFQLLLAPAIGAIKYASVHEKLTRAGTIRDGKATKYELQDGKTIKYEMQEGKATKYDMQEGKGTKLDMLEGKTFKHGTQQEKTIKHGMQEGKLSRYGTQEGKTTRYATQGRSTRYGTLEESSDRTALGSMNKMGVTRYKRRKLRKAKNQDGSFFWGDSSNRNGQIYSGAMDLTENISWGWHHPSGLYATIPVGSPLIDEDMNIYVAADDAIRKFSVGGDIIWSYAPRGQLAAAPTLTTADGLGQGPGGLCGQRRRPSSEEGEEVEEELLRPDWAKGNESEPSTQLFNDFTIGDLVKVKPGARYMAEGMELYKDGDQGVVSAIVDEGDKDSRAVIQWPHTGRKSVVQLHAMKKRFVHAGRQQNATSCSMLVGSTTAGFVFAIDLASGNELWATWASNDIAGVKGSVASKGGVVVVATDRCTDRYCYRYRNQTNVFTPGNSYVRGLSAVDGSELWAFKTTSPVWNMNPLWGVDGSVLFQDWEGRLYCLDLLTGAKRYEPVGGDIGTHTHAAAVYSAGHNVVIAMGMVHYNVNNYHTEDAIGTDGGKYCNPYPAPGILINCWTWPGGRGFVRAYNASSGRELWERNTPEPPSGASIGQMASMGSFGTRLVLTMGFNCWHGSATQIWLMDPDSGHVRWMRDGPTLWTGFCASDKEGSDIRRTMGGREKCQPNSWSAPMMDSLGDVYVGNQVGVLQRIGAPNGGGTRDIQLLSTLTTGSAFQDSAIAFADGVMAVSTCTSLIVFQTYAQNFTNETWSYTPGETHDFKLEGY